jgi:uncharacterized protein (UPF0548 family)
VSVPRELLFRRARPSDAEIKRLLRHLGEAPYTYKPVGATFDLQPGGGDSLEVTRLSSLGFDVDTHVFPLGRGGADFRAACAALDTWRLFEIGWASVVTEAEEPTPGVLLGLRVRSLGLWSVLVSRVLDVTHDDEPRSGREARHSFTYGTVSHHVESGEERFAVTWDAASDEVRFEIVAYSRPRHLLARLGYPFVRTRQAAFGVAAATAMRRAVGSPM